jgi:uncharacterized protein YcbK (DUF882 family)
MLTPHFSRTEFMDKRANAFLDPPVMLLGVLEYLRGSTGRPLIIVSGYRTAETNRMVGGARESRHLHGDAVDIPAGYCSVAQAEAAGAVGIGSKDGWAIHLDVRPGPPARWNY